MRRPKYKIYDKIIGGTIFGINSASIYRMKAEQRKSPLSTTWDIQFPNWDKSYVYSIYLDKPQKILSKNEFIKQCPYIKEEYIDSEYEKLEDHYELTMPEASIVLEKGKQK